MKKGIVIFVSMAAFWSAGATCSAEIIPPYGPGQIGYTGVVLCDSLSLRQSPDFESGTVKTLRYGDRVMVMSQENGWAECAISDDVNAGPAGYVNTDYLAVDPSWYKTEEETTVYAWNDTSAKKVAFLSKDTTLPILKNDGEWLVVSLRGASGWIHINGASQSQKSSEKAESFTVYAEDGSTVRIHHTEGKMYEDEKGRTYSNTEDTVYYCIVTDVTYSSNPDFWKNAEKAAEEHQWTGADFGENPDYVNEWTGEDFGENPDYASEWTGEDFGENYN